MAENQAWYAAHGFAEVAREERSDRTIVYMERPVAAGSAWPPAARKRRVGGQTICGHARAQL